jgi:L-fuconolactonase
MPVIDCHHHFWLRAKREHKFPEAVGNRLDNDYTPADLRPELKSCGVDSTVLVQTVGELDETREMLATQREVDFVAGVVGWVPLTEPAACAKAIEGFKKRGKLVGIRHLIPYEPDPEWVLQETVLESLKQLAAANLVFEAIPVDDKQFEAVLKMTRQLPELKVVLNHMGRPPVPEGGWEPWATQIARAAELRNMSVKLSAGLHMVLHWKWSTDAMRRYADHVIDLFSPDRVMAASNWPVILLAGSYSEVWTGLTELVSGLSEPEQQAVLGGTAQRIFGL